MIVLAVDTSGPSAGVALMTEGVFLYEATVCNRLTHSENIMPMVEEALRRGGVAIGDVQLFAAVAGPGSFTGVRIGVSAVKGMAQALAKPCIGVNALEALAMGLVETPDEVVCAIRDARAGQVYGAAFASGRRITEDLAMKLSDFIAAVDSPGRRFVFIGDAVPPYRKAIALALGERASYAPEHLLHLKAGAAAAIALRDREKAVEAAGLIPLYLRPPGALRRRSREATDD